MMQLSDMQQGREGLGSRGNGYNLTNTYCNDDEMGLLSITLANIH